MSGTPHLERARELLWETGHPHIAEALAKEVETLTVAASAVLEAARTSGSVALSLREDLAEALGLPREAAHGRYTLVMAARRSRGGVA